MTHIAEKVRGASRFLSQSSAERVLELIAERFANATSMRTLDASSQIAKHDREIAKHDRELDKHDREIDKRSTSESIPSEFRK